MGHNVLRGRNFDHSSIKCKYICNPPNNYKHRWKVKFFLWCWCYSLYTIHVFCFSICYNNCCTPVFGFQETCMHGSSLQVRLFLGSVHYCKPQPIKLQDIASLCGKREGWIKMLCSPRHLVTLQQWTAYWTYLNLFLLTQHYFRNSILHNIQCIFFKMLFLFALIYWKYTLHATLTEIFTSRCLVFPFQSSLSGAALDPSKQIKMITVALWEQQTHLIKIKLKLSRRRGRDGGREGDDVSSDRLSKRRAFLIVSHSSDCGVTSEYLPRWTGANNSALE